MMTWRKLVKGLSEEGNKTVSSFNTSKNSSRQEEGFHGFSTSMEPSLLENFKQRSVLGGPKHSKTLRKVKKNTTLT
jgi:hypothetical protein